MKNEEIRQRIIIFSKKHQSAKDFDDAKLIELDVQDLICNIAKSC